MKVKFEFCCYEKVIDYVEQTPEELIESDFTDWIEKIKQQARWKYTV